jgi:hypothetical protein
LQDVGKPKTREEIHLSLTEQLMCHGPQSAHALAAQYARFLKGHWNKEQLRHAKPEFKSQAEIDELVGDLEHYMLSMNVLIFREARKKDAFR